MKVPTKRRVFCRAPDSGGPGYLDREELLCSMLERPEPEGGGGDGGGGGDAALLPAACFLGECRHRKSSLQRQLEAPPLNRKGPEASLEPPLALFLGYSTVLHKPTTCVYIEDSVTSLHRACATVDPRQAIRDICRRHPQLVNVQNGSGQTPLHVLLLYQSRCPSRPVLEEACSTLLAAGSRLDVADQDGDTPLLYLRSFVANGHAALAMARRPAEMQAHVLGAMVSQGQHFRLLGPVFLELKSRMRRFWSQPAELRHLSCEAKFITMEDTM
ncbi:uncharacterized protein LOC119089791 [Pollicipes pollicipes]|uniref:uncharacterized protein LOC119089791 n=1 Tax=Pollicipes pollicipes TaxID=41117 RepID=UPI001884FF0F|nr:uncharacterized protein LOC119089791 [Pollicipes pollicipes]